MARLLLTAVPGLSGWPAQGFPGPSQGCLLRLACGRSLQGDNPCLPQEGGAALPAATNPSTSSQVEAERRKRATVLESEGTRESAINVAEGHKQAQILASEAQKAEQINKASGNGVGWKCSRGSIIPWAAYGAAPSRVGELRPAPCSNRFSHMPGWGWSRGPWQAPPQAPALLEPGVTGHAACAWLVLLRHGAGTSPCCGLGFPLARAGCCPSAGQGPATCQWLQGCQGSPCAGASSPADSPSVLFPSQERPAPFWSEPRPRLRQLNSWRLH